MWIPSLDQRALERRARTHELLVLRVRAKAHDALDAGAVVPTAVEQHGLTRPRAAVRCSAGSTTACADAPSVSGEPPRGGSGIEPVGDALDGAALAGRVTTLEHHHEPVAGLPDPFLHGDEQALQARHLLGVFLFCQLHRPLGGVRQECRSGLLRSGLGSHADDHPPVPAASLGLRSCHGFRSECRRVREIHGPLLRATRRAVPEHARPESRAACARRGLWPWGLDSAARRGPRGGRRFRRRPLGVLCHRGTAAVPRGRRADGCRRAAAVPDRRVSTLLPHSWSCTS